MCGYLLMRDSPCWMGLAKGSTWAAELLRPLQLHQIRATEATTGRAQSQTPTHDAAKHLQEIANAKLAFYMILYVRIAYVRRGLKVRKARPVQDWNRPRKSQSMPTKKVWSKSIALSVSADCSCIACQTPRLVLMVLNWACEFTVSNSSQPATFATLIQSSPWHDYHDSIYSHLYSMILSESETIRNHQKPFTRQTLLVKGLPEVEIPGSHGLARPTTGPGPGHSLQSKQLGKKWSESLQTDQDDQVYHSDTILIPFCSNILQSSEPHHDRTW